MIVSNLPSHIPISELVDQLKLAYDNLNNAFDRAQKEAIKSEISGKSAEINDTVIRTSLAINRALSRGIIADVSRLLLQSDTASQLKLKWAKASGGHDKAECFRIASEVDGWSSEVLDDINILWTTKLSELEQEIRTSIATIAIVKPEKNFSDVLNRLDILKRPNGGLKSIVEVSVSTWDKIVNGQVEIHKELESIKDIPDHVMDFLRRQSVSLAEYESEGFKPTREWISSNQAIVAGLTVKWGN